MCKTNRVLLFNSALLRASAWPIETILEFASPILVDLAREVFILENKIHNNSILTISTLHKAIPSIKDKKVRHYLLLIKRHVYKTSLQIPTPSSDVDIYLKTEIEISEILEIEALLRRNLECKNEEFKRAYRSELDRQRIILKNVVTQSDFQKALIISNLDVATLYRKTNLREDSRRFKRMEKTLFNYLVRACSRPTPNGTWAGTTTVEMGDSISEKLSLCKVKPHYEVTVDLQPFLIAFRYLSNLPRYRKDYPLRLNPTISRDNDKWFYERNSFYSNVTGSLPKHPLSDIIIDYYKDGEPHKIQPLLEALASNDSIILNRLDIIVDKLIDADVLRVDLNFPAVTESVWISIEKAISQMTIFDQTQWTRSLKRIQELCKVLELNFNKCSPVDIATIQDKIKKEIQEIWFSVGLMSKIQNPILRVDYHLPYKVKWNNEYHSSLTDSINDFLTIYQVDGGAELYRMQTANFIQNLVGKEVTLLRAIRIVNQVEYMQKFRSSSKASVKSISQSPINFFRTREQVFSRFSSSEIKQQQIDEQNKFWEQIIDPSNPSGEVILPSWLLDNQQLKPGFGGSLLIPLWQDDLTCMGSGRPQLGLFIGRLSRSLSKREDEENKLARSIREWFKSAETDNISFLEIASVDALNLNAAIRPQFTSLKLDVHHPDSFKFRELHLIQDEFSKAYWLTDSDKKKFFIPVYNSCSAIGYHNPSAWLLMNLSMTYGWEFISFNFFEFGIGKKTLNYYPRVLMPNGELISRETWKIPAKIIAIIKSLNWFERYFEWRKHAFILNLPSLVFAQNESENSEFLLRTDSPLAIQHFFDSFNNKDDDLILREFPGNPLELPVKDENGNHYISELAVCWTSSD